MVEVIRKVITCEVKEISDRVLEFIGSTETQDRDGEVIRASGWNLKNYKKNPVFMWAHRYDQPPIGKAQKVWVEDGKLKFDIEFADKDTYEFADTIYRLFKGGFLKATSVGFIPDEDAIEQGDGEKTPRRTYGKQELLELSAVPVPSNPDALVQARESGLITVKELEAITKPEETEDYIRIPVPKEEGKHEGHRIRTIDVSKDKGIKGLYCGECKVIITYLFSKDDEYGWTMESAKEWVEEHKGIQLFQTGSKNPLILPPDSEPEVEMGGKSVCRVRGEPEQKEVSQTEIADHFDYTKSLIEKGDLNEANEAILKDIASAIIERLPGSDIPVDIQLKVGAVLNTKNRENLTKAQALIQVVLDSAEKPTNNETEGISDTDVAGYIASVIGGRLVKHLEG